MSIKHVLTKLITPSKLKNLTAQPSFAQNYRILEANVGTNATEQYNQGHIDKAIYIDLLKCTEATKLIPRNIPSPQCFQEYLGSLGISNKHDLIIYDRSPFGFFASSRLWFILRLFGDEKVSVLNGGLNGWLKKDYPLSTEKPDFPKEDFLILVPRKDLLRNYDQIVENIKSQREQLVDVRSPADFQKIDPLTGLANHVPNAKNLPYNSLFDEKTGRLKTPKEILELVKLNSIDLNKPIVVMCNMGMMATTLALALDSAGIKDVPIYYGSWNEFSQRRALEANKQTRIIS